MNSAADENAGDGAGDQGVPEKQPGSRFGVYRVVVDEKITGEKGEEDQEQGRMGRREDGGPPDDFDVPSLHGDPADKPSKQNAGEPKDNEEMFSSDPFVEPAEAQQGKNQREEKEASGGNLTGSERFESDQQQEDKEEKDPHRSVFQNLKNHFHRYEFAKFPL
jgi:hypothetical protein